MATGRGECDVDRHRHTPTDWARTVICNDPLPVHPPFVPRSHRLHAPHGPTAAVPHRHRATRHHTHPHPTDPAVGCHGADLAFCPVFLSAWWCGVVVGCWSGWGAPAPRAPLASVATLDRLGRRGLLAPLHPPGHVASRMALTAAGDWSGGGVGVWLSDGRALPCNPVGACGCCCCCRCLLRMGWVWWWVLGVVWVGCVAVLPHAAPPKSPSVGERYGRAVPLPNRLPCPAPAVRFVRAASRLVPVALLV